MASNSSIIEKVNNYLLDSEAFANEFLPLRETLMPIQDDFKSALEELKEKANKSEDLPDKVFYLNRYTDLVKKVEGVFDTRSKRLQQTLSMLSKLPEITKSTENVDDIVDEDNNEESNNTLTPEEANQILMILNKTSE